MSSSETSSVGFSSQVGSNCLVSTEEQFSLSSPIITVGSSSTEQTTASSAFISNPGSCSTIGIWIVANSFLSIRHAEPLNGEECWLGGSVGSYSVSNRNSGAFSNQLTNVRMSWFDYRVPSILTASAIDTSMRGFSATVAPINPSEEFASSKKTCELDELDSWEKRKLFGG